MAEQIGTTTGKCAEEYVVKRGDQVEAVATLDDAHSGKVKKYPCKERIPFIHRLCRDSSIMGRTSGTW